MATAAGFHATCGGDGLKGRRAAQVVRKQVAKGLAAKPNAGTPGGRALEGRAALVTGSGQRIGAAIATRLAEAGCDVVLHHHRSAAAAQKLAAELGRHTVATATVGADLSEGADRLGLVAKAAKTLDRPIDLLVNNASTFPERRLSDLTLPDLHEDLEVNAWAPFELTMQLARGLPAGATGSVVNLLDARIVDEDRRHVGYHLGKRMLADFTRLCALELAPRVTVNGVAPGPTLPPPGTPEESGDRLMARLRDTLPLQRTPAPAELAEAVAYLLGAPGVTGQVLFVDGGRHLGRQPAR